jgi:hypothetical protein
MTDGKKWAAGGAIAAVLALVVGVPTLMHHPEPGPLEEQVTRLRAEHEGQSAAARHHNVAERIDRLHAVVQDPGFERLPPSLADYVCGRLHELEAYRDYAREVEALPDPADAEDRHRLDAARARLNQVKPPARYEAEWRETDAGRRYARLVADGDALDGEVKAVRDGYRRVTAEGKAVLQARDQPNLPGRARAVLARADALPGPKKDRSKSVPGSDRVTYAAVFRFDEVQQAYAAWVEVRATLRPIAELAAP